MARPRITYEMEDPGAVYAQHTSWMATVLGKEIIGAQHTADMGITLFFSDETALVIKGVGLSAIMGQKSRVWESATDDTVEGEAWEEEQPKELNL